MNADGSFTCIKGDTIRFPMAYTENDGTTPVDLTGWEIKAQMRYEARSAYVVLEFEILDEDPESGATYYLADGEFLVYAAAEDTATISKDEAVWDLQVTSPGGIVTTLIGPASVELLKDVTRA